MTITTSGRWTRQGERIALFPARAEGVQEEVGGPISPASAIHPAIDVHAQYALVRMSKADSASRAAARGMLNAVKEKRLGIYKEDQQVPAVRAKRLGGWWKVIPKGQNAAVFLDPDQPFAQIPLIVFRDAVKNAAAQLDGALREAWETFQMLARCELIPQGGRLGDAGRFTPPNLVPALLCSRPSPPPPLFLRVKHLHVPRPLVPMQSLPAVAEMEPDAMDPGFSGSRGLDAALKAVLRRAPYASRKIAAAVVDLTGPRLMNPDFAGFHEDQPMEGASLAKIMVMYAIRQLQFELVAVATRRGITTAVQLRRAMSDDWAAAGLAREFQPALDRLFRFQETGAGPVSVELCPDTEALLFCAVSGSDNGSASALMGRVGLPYMGSLMQASGLFRHDGRGGIWMSAGYGGMPTRSCAGKGGDVPNCAGGCCGGLQGPQARQGPPGLAAHNVTARSVATLLTLLAQRRLANPGVSDMIGNALVPTCTFFGRDRAIDMAPRRGKCGRNAPFQNDCVLADRLVFDADGQRPRWVQFAAVLLTEGVMHASLFRSFIADVHTLVRDNNPPPPPSPTPRPIATRSRR